MVEQAGALGYFGGHAQRAAVGTELIERVTATGSLVIRKLGATRAGELAIHRFLSAPSVTCQEMLGPGGAHAIGDGRPAHCRRPGHRRDQFRRPRGQRCGLGAAGDGVSAGFFIHPLVAIDSETEAVLGLLDAQIWTREDAIEAAPRRQRAIEDKESMRWLERGVEQSRRPVDGCGVCGGGRRPRERHLQLLRPSGGWRRSDRSRGAGSADRRRAAGAGRADASLFTSPAAWPELTQMLLRWHRAGWAIPVGSPRSPCEPARLSSSGRVMALPKPTRRRWR